jgi:predicted PolB exonuclease-like 3'-5' exonuclease
MAPVLVFDIETIPDIAGLRRLGALPDAMSDAEVAEAAFARRREKTGSDFLPLHLHRVIAIGCLFRDADTVRVRCLGSSADDEARLIADFFRIIERHVPTLVSWNGSGFDLPVLHYRALVHGIQAPRYWDMGEDDRDFRFNNYISRYHSRHTDLMDVLALYNGRAAVPLDDLSRLCGLPGKLGMDGAQVWPAWREGRIDEIRAYCETDVANTWMMYCRFQQLRGVFGPERLQHETQLMRDALAGLPGDHWRAYLQAWAAAGDR